jgi:hypothetical protein
VKILEFQLAETTPHSEHLKYQKLGINVRK